jgi:ketosteroid isomerase-like protein
MPSRVPLRTPLCAPDARHKQGYNDHHRRPLALSRRRRHQDGKIGLLGLTEAKVREFVARWRAADDTVFANVEPMIHPDALFRFNDGDYRGMASVRHAFESTAANASPDERFHWSDYDVLFVGEQSAIVTFDWIWSGTQAAGPFRVEGRGTSVIVDTDRGPQVMLEHLGTDRRLYAGVTPREESAQQDLLARQSALDPERFDDAFAGTFTGDGGATLRFSREGDQMFVHIGRFKGRIVPISPQHFLLLFAHDVAFRFSSGKHSTEVESQSGSSLRIFNREGAPSA